MLDVMSKTEALQMMKRCLDEIQAQRRELDILRPKAEAYDNISTILQLLPQPSRTMKEDLVWALKRRIEQLTAPSEPSS